MVRNFKRERWNGSLKYALWASQKSMTVRNITCIPRDVSGKSHTRKTMVVYEACR